MNMLCMLQGKIKVANLFDFSELSNITMCWKFKKRRTGQSEGEITQFHFYSQSSEVLELCYNILDVIILLTNEIEYAKVLKEIKQK